MEWRDTVQKVVNESVKLSKQAFDKTKELGSITKKEFELRSRQSDAQKEFAALGGVIYRKLVEENNETVDKNDEDIASVIDSISMIGNSIKALESEIIELRKSKKE